LRDLDNTKQDFRSVPDCQTCMCKRGITYNTPETNYTLEEAEVE